MENTDLNALRDRAYKIACDHGFHDKELSDDHFLMLVITELSEVVEADRKNRHADVYSFVSAMDIIIDSFLSESNLRNNAFKVSFQEKIKDSVEDELADTVIRLLDLAGLREIDLDPLELPIQKSCTSDVMTIFCFDAISFIYMKNAKLKDKICVLISFLFEKAQNDGIDLFWHIEQKMRYNELRPNMHGKKY